MHWRALVPPTILYTRKGKKQVIALVSPVVKGKTYKGMGRKDRERRDKAMREPK